MLLSLVVSAALAIQSLVVRSISWLSDFIGDAKWWDTWQAFGTVGATIVALALGFAGSIRGRKAQAGLKTERAERFEAERLATASLVSAWIESEYVYLNDGRQYRRQDVLFVANESNEPVFDAHLLVGTGIPPVQVGPLAAPETIPVLPARSKRSWDISHGMLAHLGPYQFPASPVASVDFADSRDVRWKRSFDGRLKEITSEQPPTQLTEDEGQRQLGDRNFFNPIWVAITFLNMLRDEEKPVTTAALSPLFAEYAQGLAEVSDADWREMAKSLNDYCTATHVWYPAPQVAYVRLVPAQTGVYDVHIGTQVEGVQFLTLVFYAGTGWRIFSIGGRAAAPDWILFPSGAISDNPRGPLPEGQ
jgi:hypothetical protein